MQIGLLNHLSFPPSGNPAPVDSSADATPSTSTAASANAQTTSSVVLQLQSDGSTASGQGTQNLVYSNAPAGTASTESDTAGMAEQYRQAVARNNGVSTPLSVGKDGVLVAKTAAGAAGGTTAASPPQDFVKFAVSAMRNYAEEQSRLQTTAQPASSTASTSLIARGLGDMQKLASRFNLFT